MLDLGSTSPANIRYCTERGHKIYSDDLLLSSTDPSLAIKDENGKPVLDSKRFLEENLVFPAAQFDVVLCWNLADYLDESLVKPVVGRLWSLLKPGGTLLAFFHTQEAGPDAPCYRYHIVGADTLEMQLIDTRGENRKRSAAAALPITSACNVCSTTGTSKIFSATLPPSSSFSPGIMCAKCWLFAEFAVWIFS